MKTIVTGGAGFIGSHIVERLLQDGHEVTVIDNFANGDSANLAQVVGNHMLTVQSADVADFPEINAVFSGVDWVFHLAALADIVPSIEDPLKYHRVNVDGTAKVLEASRQAGVHRFVYAASSSCYGLAQEFPTPETADISLMYPYALTKYLGEQYVRHWAKVYKLPCVSLRLFNVYGPRSRTSGTYGAVFGVFLAQKLAGKPFTVVGDGNQTRDFTYVTDVAEAFVLAAQSSLGDEVLNVGSGNTYSVNKLVELLENDAGVVNLPKRPGEPDCTHADISKVTAKLGWSPKVSLEEGIGVLLEDVERWRSAPVWDEASIGEATRHWFRYLS